MSLAFCRSVLVLFVISIWPIAELGLSQSASADVSYFPVPSVSTSKNDGNDVGLTVGVFQAAEKSDLPDKLYKDCLRCPRLNACDEIAMVRGEVPNFAILAADSRDHQRLVEIANWL